MNENYVDEDPFHHKGEGSLVESLNQFIMMSGLLEGTIDVIVPDQIRGKKSWDSYETPQKARFCKFILSNMSGTNNGTSLKFNNGQKALIKVEVYMAMLDKIKELKINGSGLDGLKVNVLKKYPVSNENDVIIEGLNLNDPLVDILDNRLEYDTFYLELIATKDNVNVENIYFLFKTKKLAGDGRLSIAGDQIYIGEDKEYILPIFTRDEFERLFNLYIRRDLNTVQEAEAYLSDPNTPDGAMVLLPKEAL